MKAPHGRVAGDPAPAPLGACIYTQDMYAVPEFSRATVAVTASVILQEDDVHHHDGLRRAGPDVRGRPEEAPASTSAGLPMAVAP